MDFSLRQHPVQGFQWGDYTAKPEHTYTCTVVARGGAPGALTTLAEVSVDVTTEADSWSSPYEEAGSWRAAGTLP